MKTMYFLIIGMSICGFGIAYAQTPSQDNFTHQIISLDNLTLDAQIADTTQKMELGLQYQNKLPYNQGMLFVLQTPQVIPMWMPNMKFSLDMIWFDSNGNILHIEKNVPPCTFPDLSSCPIYNRDGQPSKYALEVTSGFVDKYNISMNSKLATPIPEFGSLATIIIAISVIGIITISKKFRQLQI